MLFAVLAHGSGLPAHEALSGIFGSISLAAWIFVLVPQLVENYKQSSAEGISLAFLAVWFVGDVTNLIGALWAGLVPTVIALAVYFCFADFILISQCIYYNALNARRRRKESQGSSVDADGEERPLLGGLNNDGLTRTDSIGLPGSHRRSSAASRRARGSQDRRDSLAIIIEEEDGARAWLKNTLCVLAVCAAGSLGWVLAWRTGAWKEAPTAGDDTDSAPMAIGAQVLGYFSAVCYLGARIPQIIKNQREKSCEGLSLLFFLLSLLGNLTYGAGILFHSLEEDYVLTNLPWLVGSLGTVFEDCIIFIQFRMYGDNNEAAVE